MVIVGSSYLADHGRPYNRNVKVLPLGLDTAEYKSDVAKPDDGKIRLVWVGSESTLPYIMQMSGVLEEIGSRFENVVLRLICDNFFDLENMAVEKHLWSKENRGIDLAACDIGLAPLPGNRFTKGKCSFKVLEYSSAGLPVIGSPVGTNSDFIRDGKTGFIVNSMQEWIERIVELIENSAKRKLFAEAGQEWATNFDVNVIGEAFCDLIEGCLVADR
jgi:glycosyltransferase involved in cell wall biosynthesis